MARLSPLVLVLWIAHASAATADPISISFSATAASFSAGNDFVDLLPVTNSFAIDLSLPSQTFALQPGLFTVFLSPGQDVPLTLSRQITIEGVSQTVTQSGTLSITPTVDTLTIFDSSVHPYDLGGTLGTRFLTVGGVTERVTLEDFFNAGGISVMRPFTLAGTVSETNPVPEPGTLVLLSTSLVAAAGCARVRRRKTSRRA
jgi:hypothetical protein